MPTKKEKSGYKELDEFAFSISNSLATEVENACKKSNRNHNTEKDIVGFCDPIRYEHPQNIDNYNILDNVIILGLNPSSNDIDKTGSKKNAFLQYLDKEEFGNIPNELREYSYGTYFSQGYRLFKDFGYNLLWRNSMYLEDCMKNVNMTEQHKNYLREKTLPNKKYIIFADLVYYKEQDAKYMYQGIRRNEEDIYKLFKMQVKYYKPKLILIANAFVSEFLLRCIQECGEKTDMKPKTNERVMGVPVIFSSMLSGGNLDRYSFLRLKKEIEGYLIE